MLCLWHNYCYFVSKVVFLLLPSVPQILNVKPHNLLHKSKLGLTSGSSNLCSSTTKTSNKLERKVCFSVLSSFIAYFHLQFWISIKNRFVFPLKVYVREPAAPFVSMAEMMKKFQSSTRDLSLPHSFLSNVNKKNHIILAPTWIWFLNSLHFLVSFLLSQNSFQLIRIMLLLSRWSLCSNWQGLKNLNLKQRRECAQLEWRALQSLRKKWWLKCQSSKQDH